VVEALERLIELDEQETQRQRDRVAFLTLAGAILQALPDALVVTDLRGVILMVNQRAEQMFGYHRSELIGRQVDTLLPPELRNRHARHRIRYNSLTLSAHTRTMGRGLQLRGQRRDGAVFPADIVLGRLVIPGGTYNLALVRNSTPDTLRQNGVPAEADGGTEDEDRDGE
jgi:PAS domain S-box-containing protein